MIVGGIYSFNRGREVIEADYSDELSEIIEIIKSVDSITHKTKVSEEKTMPGKLLFKPSSLNKSFKREFIARGWNSNTRVLCDYPTGFYTPEYSPPSVTQNAYREMDFIKNRLGVEVQFGKYAFMGRIYDLGEGQRAGKKLSKRPFTQANRKCSRWLNPSSLQRIPTPLNRCCMSHLQVLSTKPLPIGISISLNLSYWICS